MDFALIETLRWQPEQGFVRLERHLARLEHSAAALGFDMPSDIPARLEAAAAGGDSPLRMRLTLDRTGRVDITATPFSKQHDDAVWRVRIAEARLTSGDTLLRHKTTRRAVYDAARAEATASEADEMILLNERDEVCEGTITNVFVADGDGTLLTPPLSCGLLPGILRGALIDQGKARCATLSRQDLATRPLYVGNSLRGLIRAQLGHDA